MALTDEQATELAGELRVAATWLDGPQKVKLVALAHQLEGAEPTEATAKAHQELYDQAVALSQSSVLTEQAQPKPADAPVPTD